MDQALIREFMQGVERGEVEFVSEQTHPFMDLGIDTCDRCGEDVDEGAIYRVAARVSEKTDEKLTLHPYVLIECPQCADVADRFAPRERVVVAA